MFVPDIKESFIVKDCAFFDLDQMDRYNKRHLAGDNVRLSVWADFFENPIFLSYIIAILVELVVRMAPRSGDQAWYFGLARRICFSSPMGAIRECLAE